MKDLSKVEAAHQGTPPTDPPTDPVVQCLHCHKDFVWWLHPVQLCDGCVDLEYAKAEVENRGA